MRNLAHRLIAAEHHLGEAANTGPPAAFRVCAKLQAPLTHLVGTHGYRALLGRALTLAQGEVPWLAGLSISGEGKVEIPEGVERLLEPGVIAAGGAALLGQLLELLATFIGESLTQRLTQQIWPKAGSRKAQSEGTK